jgi:Arc/MetJ-type ribon-helix-helix transcriptional regulator
MSITKQFIVTLPVDLAEAVENKIQSGLYASVSDFVCDGLETLLARDAAIEHWLREDVVAGHTEYLADPSQVVPAEDILSRVRSRRLAAKNAICVDHDNH